jgi:hypothetical protein
MKTIPLKDCFDIAPGIMTSTEGAESEQVTVLFPPRDGSDSSWAKQNRSLRPDFGKRPTISKGDLLVSLKSSKLSTLIATEEHEGLTPSKAVAVFTPKDNNAALVYWLQNWLKSSDFRLKYFDAISRSSVGHLSPSAFWSVEMPEPSSSKLLELERITHLLDRSQKDLELTLYKIKKLREVEIDILFAD